MTKLEAKIDTLIAGLEQMISRPAIPAIPPIPAIPAIVPSGDHDLLIKVEAKLDGLIASFNSSNATYVTKEAFDPVRRIAYGLVGVIVTAVVLAVIALVIK